MGNWCHTPYNNWCIGSILRRVGEWAVLTSFLCLREKKTRSDIENQTRIRYPIPRKRQMHLIWRCSQVVRQRTANPLSPSSNLGTAYCSFKDISFFLLYRIRDPLTYTVGPKLCETHGIDRSIAARFRHVLGPYMVSQCTMRASVPSPGK
jgi:hypothetical protein